MRIYTIQFVTGLPYKISATILGVVATIYVTLGGMRGTTITQCIQALLMMVGVIIPLGVILAKFGGFTQMVTAVYEVKPAFWSPFGTSGLTYSICFAIVMGFGFLGLPHILMRFFASRDDVVAKRTGIINGIFNAIFYFIVFLIPTYAIVNNFIPKNADMVYYVTVGKLFNPFITGFFLACALSAILSTVSGQMLAGSSAIAYDLYSEIVKRNTDEKRQVFALKFGCVIMGIASTLTALFPFEGILLIMSTAMALVAGCLAAPLLLGIWCKNANDTGAFGVC
ncbi:MAG: hypothetical protein AB1341_15335 [Bacillota bacterium]